MTPDAAHVQQLDVFAGTIDESAGVREDLEEEQRPTQLTELPGTQFEDIFK